VAVRAALVAPALFLCQADPLSTIMAWKARVWRCSLVSLEFGSDRSFLLSYAKIK